MGVMLILRGISNAANPRGQLDDASALKYAQLRGYQGEVLDVSGNSSGPQVERALARIRDTSKPPVAALYGFSGGGYNTRHILNALNDDEQGRLNLVVILGAPKQPASAFEGDWELVYRIDPREGHMAGPRILLESIMQQVSISKAAFDLIVAEEVSSKATYEKKYRHPEWPGGASGVTIGIGYDVGAGVTNYAQLHRDWDGKIPQAMVDALVPAIGVTGERARALTAALKSKVDVPWDAAMKVFQEVTLPKYYALTAKALPNFDKLNADCKGVLVSLVYNRGASFSKDGDRYREMRAIRVHMAAKQFDKIPTELRSMARLWPGTGLVGRRNREAALFQEGLKKPLAEGAAAAVVVIAGTAVATAESKKDAPLGIGVWVAVAATIIVAIGIFFLIRTMRRTASLPVPPIDAPKHPAAEPESTQGK